MFHFANFSNSKPTVPARLASFSAEAALGLGALGGYAGEGLGAIAGGHALGADQFYRSKMNTYNRLAPERELIESTYKQRLNELDASAANPEDKVSLYRSIQNDYNNQMRKHLSQGTVRAVGRGAIGAIGGTIGGGIAGGVGGSVLGAGLGSFA